MCRPSLSDYSKKLLNPATSIYCRDEAVLKIVALNHFRRPYAIYFRFFTDHVELLTVWQNCRKTRMRLKYMRYWENNLGCLLFE
jgi:hypothetical protein